MSNQLSPWDLVSAFPRTHLRNPERIIPTLQRLMLSPVACFRQFLHCYRRDLRLDFAGTTLLFPKKLDTLDPLPTHRTYHVRRYDAFLGFTDNPTVHTMFGGGPREYQDLHGDSDTYNGPGIGILLSSNFARHFAMGDRMFHPDLNMYVHWPSILTSSAREFSLYRPVAYLALSVLPVVRTHSIALYEHLLRQITVAVYHDLVQEYPSLQHMGCPVEFLDTEPSIYEMMDNFLRYTTNPRNRTEYRIPELWEDIQEYYKAAAPYAISRLPPTLRDRSRSIISGHPVMSLSLNGFMTTATGWTPYRNLSTNAIENLDVTGDATMGPPMPICARIVAHTRSWPASAYGVSAASLWNKSHYSPAASWQSYLSQFIMELAYAAYRTRNTHHVKFAGIRTDTADPFVAINWEMASYILPYFILEPVPPSTRELLQTPESFQPVDVAHTMAKLKSTYTHVIPQALTPDMNHLCRDGDGTIHNRYMTLPLNQYTEQVIYSVMHDKQEKAIGGKTTRPNNSARRTALENAGEVPDRLYKKVVWEPVSSSTGLPTPVTVICVNIKSTTGRPRTYFNVQCDDFLTTPIDYYDDQGFLLRGCYDWSEYAQEYVSVSTDPHLVMGTVEGLFNPRLPHANHDLFHHIVPHMRAVRSYSREMFFRWVMFGDPRAPLPRGPANFLKVANDSQRTIYSKHQGLDALILKYLRPAMQREDYDTLVEFCAAAGGAKFVARRSRKMCEHLLNNGERDISMYPLKQLNLPFRRKYYTLTGISLSGMKSVPLPEGYESILLLQVEPQ